MSKAGTAKVKAKKSEINDGEEVLQAVLLADSFKKRMAPINYTTPKILLPICNVPIIEYTLELLVTAGVKELFVVCSTHADKIQDYCADSPACQQFAVHVLNVPGCKSMGEAMREVYSRGNIRGDFILVSGDVVSNIKLEPALKAHKRRREEEKNKDAILTMVFKTSPPDQRRGLFDEDDLAVFLSAETQQLLQYQTMTAKGAAIDVARFESGAQVQARYDLEYAHACVCSFEALSLFTDEFDWQDLHNDFVPGVLSSEIYSYQIHVHIASEGYSGRLTSINAFGNVNSDVIHRWAYPFVPDVNLFCDSTFEYIHPFLYKEQNVTLAQTASIGRDVLIGSGTSVGDGAVVERTTVGRNCAIGAGAVITGSILFAGVKVGAGVVVTDSIVCEDVVLQAGVKVPRNCVLGGGVVIAERVELAAESRVTWAARPVDDGNNEDDDGFGSSDEEVGEEQELESDEKVVGVGGRGRLWAPAEDEKQALRGMLVMSEAVLEDGADGSDDESSDDEGGGGRALTFEEEVHDIVRRGVDEGVKVDNVAMEVNGRKFAHDKTFGDCAAIIVPTMLGTLAPTESRKDAFAAATKLIKDWKPLVQKFARSIVDQKQTIVAIEEFVVREEWKAHKLMMPILKCMYDLDVLEDSAIVNWAADAEERDEQGQALAAECAKLVEYLEEEDEDEDESDDDE